MSDQSRQTHNTPSSSTQSDSITPFSTPDASTSAKLPKQKLLSRAILFSLSLIGVSTVSILAINGCNSGQDDNGNGQAVPGSFKEILDKAGNPAEASRPKVAFDEKTAWFKEITSSTGIDFVHVTGDSEVKPFPAANGSGVGAFDYDRDGFVDLYFATGTEFPIDLEKSTHRNQAYRNLGGNKFVNVAEATRTNYNGYSAGVTMGDYDNDGFPDLYVTCYGENIFYQNQGDGTFVRRETVAKVNDNKFATSAMFFDYDNDGLLDIYLCNYGVWSLETNIFCGDQERNVRQFCSPTIIAPEQDVVYHNLGDGTFGDATKATKVADRAAARSQGVVGGDFNDDGWVDVYVGNDLNANSLFLNQKNGTFKDISELSGTAYDPKGSPQAGMGVDAADVNQDGKFDLFVTNFKGESNALYEQRGAETFMEVSQSKGLSKESFAYVKWGAAFVDFNLDGWFDVIITNGHVDNNRHLLGDKSAPWENPGQVFRNKGLRDLKPGEDASKSRSSRWQGYECLHEAAGDYFLDKFSGRSLAVADLDNDGDQDVVIVHQDTAPGVISNLAISPTRTTTTKTSTVRFVGRNANREGLGCRLYYESGTAKILDQVVSGGSYLACHDARLLVTALAGETQLPIAVRFLGENNDNNLSLPMGGDYLVIQGNDSTPTEIISLHNIQ